MGLGGSSSTTRTTVPDYVDDANKLAIQRANQIFELGRTPFTGIDVVGINPAERAAMENVASAASAFGMAVPQGDPFEGMETQTTGGLTGYSSYPLYIADMERLKEQRPDQYAAFARMSGFDPITGAALAPQSATASGGNGYTPMRPRAGAGSESDVYISERDRIAAMGPQYAEGYAPAGVGLRDSLRRTTAAMPLVGESVSSLFGGPITYDNPTSFGGSGSLVTTGPSKANKDFFASANKGSNSKSLFSGLKGLFGG